MVKMGYKQTEVGVIPEDWEIKSLSELGTFSKGSGVRKDESNSGLLPCIRYGEIYTRHNDFIKDFYSFISKSVAIGAKQLKKGDLLFAGSGETKEEIGKSVAYIGDHEAYAGGDIVILSITSGNSKYLGYLLNAPFIQNQKSKRGQGDAVVHISSSQLGSIVIPLPPLPEQTAIAEALSDMDALIAQTEQLIEKKKAIKQGMMHELLRPKEGWVTKKLGEIAELKNGYAFKSAYYNQAGEFLIITIANVQDGHMEIADCNRISHIPDTVQSFQKLNIGDILISMTGNVGRICKVNTYKTLLNQRVGKITPTNIDGDFLFYLLRDKRFINKMILSAQGGAQGNIGKSDILDYEASLPPTPKEQARIAQILSDMDSEIEQLEKQLSKAQSIKQGMMQQLLTGKTRLI